MKLKFCGIRRPEDIELINVYTPDYIGFILAEGYRRTVSAEKVKELCKGLNVNVKKVGVFVNQPIEQVVSAYEKSGIDILQLHGDESAEYIDELRKLTDLEIWKAVRVKSISDIVKADSLNVDKILIDSFVKGIYGGTGKTADWNIIKQAEKLIKTPYFLAGGLDAENLSEALEILNPYGIDISGGIETDGVKSEEKMKQISEIIMEDR